MNNVLYDACLLSQEDWLISLQIDKDEDHAFSKRHQKKISALSDKMRSDKYHRLTRTAVKIIIVAAVILSIATTVIALPGPKKFLTSFYSDHMVISLEDADTVANNSKIAVKLPEGYTVAEEDYSEYYSTVTYKMQTMKYEYAVCRKTPKQPLIPHIQILKRLLKTALNIQ